MQQLPVGIGTGKEQAGKAVLAYMERRDVHPRHNTSVQYLVHGGHCHLLHEQTLEHLRDQRHCQCPLGGEHLRSGVVNEAKNLFVMANRTAGALCTKG